MLIGAIITDRNNQTFLLPIATETGKNYKLLLLTTVWQIFVSFSMNEMCNTGNYVVIAAEYVSESVYMSIIIVYAK